MAGDRATVDLPARKLHVADLQRLVRDGDSWQYQSEDCSFNTKLVWLQGDVTHTANGNAEITLTDGTSEVTVINCDSAPGGCDWLHEGLYVMAVGLVESAGQDSRLLVSAIKLADLSSNSTHRLTWPQEIQELKELLAENPRMGLF